MTNAPRFPGHADPIVITTTHIPGDMFTGGSISLSPPRVNGKINRGLTVEAIVVEPFPVAINVTFLDDEGRQAHLVLHRKHVRELILALTEALGEHTCSEDLS